MILWQNNLPDARLVQKASMKYQRLFCLSFSQFILLLISKSDQNPGDNQ
jgi:hypothetical protein